MPKPKYRTLCSVQRDAKDYPPGSFIALPEETAQRLLAMDPPAIEVVEEAEPAREPAVSRANAKDTIEAVKAETDIPALLAMREAEESHADGARPTVLAAIEKRLDELAAAGDDDGDDEDAGT